jgi:hypothetical protein
MEEGQGAHEARAVLEAYKLVKDASWPQLNPGMAARAAGWARASEAELRRELEGYVRELSQPGCNVRLFWKLGQDFVFAGCSDSFARDAGLSRASDLIGLTDFSDKVPWKAQASKYRFDDQEVAQSAKARLDILERQNSAAGTVWVLVGKAPIRPAGGQVIGILGMYEQLEKKVAEKMFAERSKGGR